MAKLFILQHYTSLSCAFANFPPKSHPAMTLVLHKRVLLRLNRSLQDLRPPLNDLQVYLKTRSRHSHITFTPRLCRLLHFWDQNIYVRMAKMELGQLTNFLLASTNLVNILPRIPFRYMNFGLELARKARRYGNTHNNDQCREMGQISWQIYSLSQSLVAPKSKKLSNRYSTKRSVLTLYHNVDIQQWDGSDISEHSVMLGSWAEQSIIMIFLTSRGTVDTLLALN